MDATDCITYHVACKEFREALDNQLVYLWHSTFVINERCKSCDVTVGQRLTVDVFNDDLLGEGISLHELLAHLLGQLTFQAVADETAPQCRTAAFIAQDITQRGDLVNYLLAVVKTGV